AVSAPRAWARSRPPRAAGPLRSLAGPGVPRGRDGAGAAQKVAEGTPPCARGGSGEQKEGQPMRCLIIEDDAETARYMGPWLAEGGYTSVVCQDGVEGLHCATHEHWDLIILDRLLPGGVDGVAMVATLRTLGKPTPVLILSALASVDERVRGLRSGGDDYLTK